MKNTFLIFLVLIILLSMCMLSCNPSEGPRFSLKTNTYIADSTNIDSPAAIQNDSPWSTSHFQNPNAPKEKTTMLYDQEYSGTYTYSAHELYTSFATDYYRTDDGLIFGIHSVKGTLVMANVMNKDFFKTEPYLPDLENAEEYAIAYATEIAASYIDLTNYTCEVIFYDDQLSQNEPPLDWYYVSFTKYVNGWRTMDCITIRITAKGHFASFLAQDIEVFDNFSHPDCNKDTINSEIEMLLTQMSERSGVTFTSYKLDNQFLALTPNNTYALCSEVFVFWKPQDSEEYSAGYTLVSEFGTKETQN